MIKRVVQVGHDSLKAKNEDIADFSDPKLKGLIKDLTDTMYKTGLVGIAAPQIGINFNIFLTHPRNTATRKLFREDILRIFINPKIIKSSGDVEIYEGCGSVARGELFGPVKRAGTITVEAFDEKMQKFSLTCDGLLARIILHEVDHLKGVEFIQKINDYENLLSGTYYRRNVKNSDKQLEAIKINTIKYKKLS